jgi:sarcosine oxidase
LERPKLEKGDQVRMLDVFVAGLGVMGSATARALARAGLSVGACDAFHPPHDRGSSHGESRIIRAAYYEDPIYTPLARRSFALWRELAQETGQVLLRKTGGLNIGPHNGMLVNGALMSARAHGIPHELLSAADVMARFPGMHMDHNLVALLEPDAAVLDPEVCLGALLESARAAGAALRFDEKFIGWRSDGTSVVIETARAEYQARSLILAVGPWLPWFKPLLSLRVTRQPVFWFEPTTPDVYSADRQPHYLIEYELGRIFYGFPDLGRGVKCGLHYNAPTTTADHVDRTLRTGDVDAVRALLEKYLPAAAGPLLRQSVCLYTNTPDLHFLVDRDPLEPQVWLLSACSGHGFKFAPAIAELVVNAGVQGGALPRVFAADRSSLARPRPH